MLRPNPADINLDGCVQLNDLLDLLSAYVDCGAEESQWQCGDPLEYQGYDYETVQIGEQCWFAENLRSENYRNGDLIPASVSDGDWESATLGAVAVYGEDSGCQDFAPNLNSCDPMISIVEYGRLYNWHTVNDERQPWMVPSDEGWTELSDFLGMNMISIGEAMKAPWELGWWWQRVEHKWFFGDWPVVSENSNGAFLAAGLGANYWSSTNDLE